MSSRTKRGLWILGVTGAALWVSTLAACETDDGSDVQSYTDNAGRSCTVDLADITRTASCDADPSALVECTDGQEAAFVMHDDYDFETEISIRQNCAACIDPAERTTYLSDQCVTVSCETDDDCLNRDGDTRPFACSGGICMN